ncbi:MAG: S41 family peptidase [Candidatus Paceibacterota bacterium]
MRTEIKKLLVSFLLVLLLGVSFGAGFWFGQEKCEVCPPSEIDMSLFWESWETLHDKYVDAGKLGSQQLIYGAISGMVKSLDDPYTLFMEPSDAKRFRENVSGDFEGIGAEIGIREGQLQIIAPLEGTPAEKAGIQAGDKVLEVNGSSTQGITVEKAVEWIRGPKGSVVTLTIARDGWEESKPIDIERSTIEIPSMDWEMKEGKIAYIKLEHFTEALSSSFREAAIEITKKDAKGIVLDVRNNPGGYLSVAQDITGWFIDKGKVIAIEDFGSDREDKKYKSQGPGTFSDLPVVVLVNQGSASASEILAGALRDQRGVKLIGTKSFGKGSVQELSRLDDGSSLKITVAKWLTPNGDLIADKGLEPDVKVERTEEDYKNDKDPQLKKALEIIRNLTN